MNPFASEVERARAKAQRDRKPLLFFFNGLHSPNCRKAELTMLKPEAKRIAKRFTLVSLSVDYHPTFQDTSETRRYLAEARTWQSKFFSESFMPSFAIVAPEEDSALATYIGIEPPGQRGSFRRFLDDGWTKWRAQQPQAGRD